MRLIYLGFLLLLAGCVTFEPTTEINFEKESIKPELIVGEKAINIDTKPLVDMLRIFIQNESNTATDLIQSYGDKIILIMWIFLAVFIIDKIVENLIESKYFKKE